MAAAGEPVALESGRFAVLAKHLGGPRPTTWVEVWVPFKGRPAVEAPVWWDERARSYNSNARGVLMPGWYVMRPPAPDHPKLASVWVP